MTAISIEHGVQIPIGTTQPPEGGVSYEYHVFTEASDPARAFEAQLTHAEGYYTAGFVDERALTMDGMTEAMIASGKRGRLIPEVDHARGPQMDYYTAQVVGKPGDTATLRKFNLKSGQTHRDLPAWELSARALSPLGRIWIENLGDQESRLKEINAFARSASAHPLTAHAVLRRAIHDALGNDEFWFSTLIAPTHDSLVKRYSEANLRVLGTNVTIDDPRVSPNLQLRPIVLRPDDFLDNLADAYDNAETAQERKRYGETLMFFSDGLVPDQISSQVHAARQEVHFSRLGRRQ